MASFDVTATTPADATLVTAFFADMANLARWDPSVRSVERLDDSSQPPSLHSRFRVRLEVGNRTLELDYEVIELQPGARVRVVARTSQVVSDDTITVEPLAEGCRFHYLAVLQGRGLWRLADPAFSRVIRRLGAQAEPGLRREVDRLAR